MSDMSERVEGIVRWQHRRGGDSQCLVRLVRPVGKVRPVMVVSDIHTAPYGRGIGDDLAAVAQAALEFVKQYADVDPSDLWWLAHFGEFSSVDSAGAPEAFIGARLEWDGERYHDNLRWDYRLDAVQFAWIIGDVVLESVPVVLARLGAPPLGRLAVAMHAPRDDSSDS